MTGRLCYVLVLVFLIPATFTLKTVSLKQMEQVVSKSEFVIVLFQSVLTEQTKEMSKRVVDELDRVSGALTQDGNNRIKFLTVSLDQHPDAMNVFKLNDVPSIVIFRDKYPRIYYGQRMGYTLFSFFQELLTVEPVKIIDSKQEKKQFSFDDQSVRIISYYPKESTSGSLEIFKMAAKHYQGEITFGLIQDDKMAKSLKLKSEGDTAMMKPGERPIHVSTKFSTREEFVEWIEMNKKPLWGVLTFNNIYSVWQGVKTTFVLFLKNMEEHYSKTVLSMFKTLAKQYGPTHDLEFVIVDAGVYKDFANGVGLTDEDLPTFAIFYPRKRQEYFFPKDKQQLNIKNAKRWLDLFLSGKLESNQKSFYEDGDGVVVVDELNFDEIVLDPTKDVLLEFYAPWCGHCAALSPKYKSVAIYMQLFPSIKVGAFDVQAHKVPKNYNVTGLPTLLFFSALDKTPIPFDAGLTRDADGIIEFIQEHQSTLSEEDAENFSKYWESLKKMREPKPENGEQQLPNLEIEEEQQEEQEQVGEI